MNIWTIIPLIIIGFITVIVINLVLRIVAHKRYALAKILSNSRNREMEIENMDPKVKKIFTWVNPTMAIKELTNLGIVFGIKTYFTYFLIGFAIGAVPLYLLYKNIVITIIGAVITGFIYPNLRINSSKGKYNDKIKNLLILYFKRFSSNLNSYNFNVRRSLESVVQDIDNPIRSDLEKVLIDIRQGKELKEAFEPFTKKYNYHGVKIFHDFVISVSEVGSDKNHLLRNTAKKFSEKKYWQEKMITDNSKHLRERNLIGVTSILIIFLIMGVSMEYFNNFMSSVIGKGTITLCLIWYGVTSYFMQKMATKDPTEMN